MAEDLNINKSAPKDEKYRDLIPQIESLITGENNLIANLANIAAALHETFEHFWTGFYLRDDNMLILGPFQGPVACTRIPIAPIPRGVCGVSASERKTMIVPDVNKFDGHIACASASQSEIVVPLVINGRTELVLDIDSKNLNSYDEIDQHYLEKIIALIQKNHFST